jgi:hypothetical protein
MVARSVSRDSGSLAVEHQHGELLRIQPMLDVVDCCCWQRFRKIPRLGSERALVGRHEYASWPRRRVDPRQVRQVRERLPDVLDQRALDHGNRSCGSGRLGATYLEAERFSEHQWVDLAGCDLPAVLPHEDVLALGVQPQRVRRSGRRRGPGLRRPGGAGGYRASRPVHRDGRSAHGQP